MTRRRVLHTAALLALLGATIGAIWLEVRYSPKALRRRERMERLRKLQDRIAFEAEQLSKLLPELTTNLAPPVARPVMSPRGPIYLMGDLLTRWEPGPGRSTATVARITWERRPGDPVGSVLPRALALTEDESELWVAAGLGWSPSEGRSPTVVRVFRVDLSPLDAVASEAHSLREVRATRVDAPGLEGEDFVRHFGTLDLVLRSEPPALVVFGHASSVGVTATDALVYDLASKAMRARFELPESTSDHPRSLFLSPSRRHVARLGRPRTRIAVEGRDPTELVYESVPGALVLDVIDVDRASLQRLPLAEHTTGDSSAALFATDDLLFVCDSESLLSWSHRGTPGAWEGPAVTRLNEPRPEVLGFLDAPYDGELVWLVEPEEISAVEVSTGATRARHAFPAAHTPLLTRGSRWIEDADGEFHAIEELVAAALAQSTASPTE